MSRERLSHKGARTTRELLRIIQSGVDRARTQRRMSLEQGHQPELCFPGEKDGHFQPIDKIPDSEEIVLFYPEKHE